MRYVLWIAVGRDDGPTLRVVESDSPLGAARNHRPGLPEEGLTFEAGEGRFGPGWQFDGENSVLAADTPEEVKRVAGDLIAWASEDLDDGEEVDLEDLAALWPEELGEFPITDGPTPPEAA